MIEVELDSVKAQAALDRLAEAVGEPTEAMSAIAEYLLVSTKERFKNGGPAPDGTPWAPKSEATMDSYRRKGEGVNPKPLTHLGYLSNLGLHQDSGADFAEVSAAPLYAAVMQFGAAKGAFGKTSRGAPIPWGNIPARPYLGISAADEEAIEETVTEFIERSMEGGG